MQDSHAMWAVAAEVLGWGGAVVILLSFALLTAGRVQAHSALYHGMNIAGSFGFAVNGAWNHAFPSMTMNIIWMVIAFYGLARAKRSSRGRR